MLSYTLEIYLNYMMELVLRDVVLSRTAQYLSMFSIQCPPFLVLDGLEDLGHEKDAERFRESYCIAECILRWSSGK